MAGMIEMKNAHKILGEIPEGNRPFQRYGYRLGFKVKSHCWEMEYDSVVCGDKILLKQTVLY
jgi:hypothetical protein